MASAARIGRSARCACRRLCWRTFHSRQRPTAWHQGAVGNECGLPHRTALRPDRQDPDTMCNRQSWKGGRRTDDPMCQYHAWPRRRRRAFACRNVAVSVTAAPGFVAAGCHVGVKRKRRDLAIVATDDGRPVTAAGVFTQNKFVAPPVVHSRAILAANGGSAAAIVVNSGNANAGTGAAGPCQCQGDEPDDSQRGRLRRRRRPGLLDRDNRPSIANGKDPARASTGWRRIYRALVIVTLQVRS